MGMLRAAVPPRRPPRCAGRPQSGPTRPTAAGACRLSRTGHHGRNRGGRRPGGRATRHGGLARDTLDRSVGQSIWLLAHRLCWHKRGALRWTDVASWRSRHHDSSCVPRANRTSSRSTDCLLNRRSAGSCGTTRSFRLTARAWWCWTASSTCPAEWTEAPELLFGLSATHWGHGLALEAAREAATYAFDMLGVPLVVAATDPPNTASVRVLERLGMRFERQGQLHGVDAVFYRLGPDDLTRPA